MPKKTGPKVDGIPDDDPTPALYIHCETTYKALLAGAQSRTDDQGNEILVWEGMFTALITNKLNLSVPYYTKIRKALLEMGCIRQLRRGGGTAPSLWELIQEPTLTLYESKMPKRKKRVDRYAMQQEQLNTLMTRVSALERVTEALVEAVNGRDPS